MILAFYKVDNKKNYERHTFDCLGKEETLNALSELPDDEVKLYDTDNFASQAKTPSLADFEVDYNDTLLDGGWWCVVLHD